MKSLSILLIVEGEPSAAAIVVDELATLFPAQADSQLDAAQLLAQCLPLAAVVKGQEKIKGQTAEAYCRERCLELLRQAQRNGYRDAGNLEQLPALAPLRDDPEFERIVNEMAKRDAGT